MCRAKSNGGRRCPCSEPEARAAYRKAKRTADSKDVAPIGSGGVDQALEVGSPEADDLPDLREVWQPERVKALAEAVDEAVSEGRGMRPDEDLDSYLATRQAAKDMVAEVGGDEAACCLVGQAVAAEAERRAGVDSEKVRQQNDEWVEAKRVERDAAASEKKALEEEIKQSPVTQEIEAAREEVRVASERIRALRWGESKNDPGHEAALEKARSDLSAAQNRFRIGNSALLQSELYDAANKAEERFWALDREVKSEMSPQAKEALVALSHSYSEVLGETRPMGGVKTTWDDKTTKKAAKTFDDAAQMFPTEWLVRHNMGRPPLARISRSRAHYTSGTVKTTRKRVREGRTFIYGSPEQIPPDSAWTTHRPLTEEEREQFDQHSSAVGTEVPVRRENWEVRHDWYGDAREDEPPRGKGWEFYRDEERGAAYWRRPKYSMQKVSSRVVPEITTNAEFGVVRRGDEHHSVATHELSHRFEAVIPQIGRLERDFLDRRTTNAEGEREEQTALYGGRKHRGKREMAYTDHLVNSYMGKVYDGRTHHEVLSMGTQALFSGDDGGLIGVGRHHADPDMRAFILGVFASAGRHKMF